MGWRNYYMLLEQYDGDLSKATKEEMAWAAKCNPNTPHDARALAEEKWKTKKRTSQLAAEYEAAGYNSWYSSIDAEVVAENPKCGVCGKDSLRFIGLVKGDSRIAIAHCDNCGHDSEF